MSDELVRAQLQERLRVLSRVETQAGTQLISPQEFCTLATQYLHLSERFSKVLEISDKYQALIRSVQEGGPAPGHSDGAGRQPKRNAVEVDTALEESLERLRGSAEPKVRSLATRYKKLQSRLTKIMAISDVYQSQLRETTLRLETMARTDMLTELANRRDMTERLIMEEARSARSGQSYGVALFDIDNFKQVNDTYGHEAGDKVLIAVAQTLKTMVRASDLCARWGGEEFLLLFPETNIENVVGAAEKCRAAVEARSIEFRGKTLQVTVSGGVAAGDAPGYNSLYGCGETDASADWETLVRIADNALYTAKERGKNQVLKGDCPSS